MATFLDQLNKAERRRLIDKIQYKKNELAELTLWVASLEAELQDEVDYARRPQDNQGNAINDLDDREKLLKFFHENGAITSRTEPLGIFWHYSNVLFMCDDNNLECPQWFADKYCVSL